MTPALPATLPEPVSPPPGPPESTPSERRDRWVDVAPSVGERIRRWFAARKPHGVHETLTVITPIPSDRVADLRTLLADIDDRIHDDRLPPEERRPLPGVDGIHVLRWAILPSAVRDSGITVPETLVFWTVFDGTRAEHLRRLTSGSARARIDEIYGHCEGYPGPRAAATDVARYLEERAPAGDWIACFDGTPGRTVADIHAEEDLRVRLRDEFLAAHDWGDVSLSHVYLRAKQWVRSERELRWALDPPDVGRARSLTPIAWIVVGVLAALCRAFGVLSVVGLVAMLVGTAVGVVVAWLIGLHRAELRAERDFVGPSRPWFDAHNVAMRQREKEDAGMNRLTILTDMQPGFVRAWTIRAVLAFTNFSARRIFDGKLQGIETIHFAQWRLVDRGRRLLFMSNYDHRWDDYFRAFSDNAAPGVNAIWSNTVGFPPTSLLIGRGSRDLRTFQRAARTYQIPTDVWFFGYAQRTLTTRRINDNTQIRAGLSRHLTPPEVKEWLELVYADAP